MYPILKSIVCEFTSLSLIFRFPSEGLNVGTFIVAEANVMHIEEDRFIPGNILFSDGSSLQTTNGKTKQVIVGVSTEIGYQNRLGSERYSTITGFHQISADEVLIVDSGNNCIRSADRRRIKTEQNFAGSCGYDSKFSDGSNPTFRQPHSIIPDILNPGTLLVTDTFFQAIRQLNTQSRVASTFLRIVDAYFFPRGICQQSMTGNLFVSVARHVYRIDYHQKSITLSVGSTSSGYASGLFRSTKFSVPLEVLLMSNSSELLVTDKNSRIRTLNLESSMSSYICYEGGHRDGSRTKCHVDQPSALTVIGNTLYIGEYQRIRFIQGSKNAIVFKSHFCQ